MPAPYRTVLLDLYDTVGWADWPGWQDTLARELEVDLARVGRAYDLTRPARSEGVYPDALTDLAVVIDAIGVEIPPTRLAELSAIERAMLVDGFRLYEDSLPVVRELRGRGIPTALVSNCSHDTRDAVDRTGLEAEFDAVILSFEVRARKPKPAIYRTALSRLGATTEGAVFVDDQPDYCDGAAALGIETFLIARDGDGPSTNGHRAISDLTALL